jgi:branched-chain amino acid transport system ATP-binding protein
LAASLAPERRMPILETVNLTKRFGGLVAVGAVSLTVNAGEIYGLIGPNGAGKTTLLNCIAGALRPNGGSVRVFGQDTTGQRADEMCRLGVSRTFQIPRPFPRLTALENVMVAAVFGSPPGTAGDAAARAEAALDYVEFPRAKDAPAEHLNTVQLKRLDLARALASRPKLLLLDEFAAGLTPGELGALAAILRRIRADGITLLMVEHVMRLIMDLCERLAVIHYGEKIAEGPAAEVARDPAVLTAYLGEKYIL